MKDTSDRLQIRRADNAECDRLTALMLRSNAYQGRYRRMIENYPVTEAMIAAGEVWAAELEGEIVGFYRLDAANADLDLMFVDDKAQGVSVGRSLIAHLRARAAELGLDDVRIVSHPPAADFYRRMGAVDVGTDHAQSPEHWDRPILKLATAG